MKNGSFTLKDPERWQKIVLGAQAWSFNRNVIAYAERWARLMEERMSAGQKLEDIAEATKREAYVPGEDSMRLLEVPTAVILIEQWEYGEQLRLYYASGEYARRVLGVEANETPTMFGGMAFRLS